MVVFTLYCLLSILGNPGLGFQEDKPLSHLKQQELGLFRKSQQLREDLQRLSQLKIQNDRESWSLSIGCIGHNP